MTDKIIPGKSKIINDSYTITVQDWLYSEAPSERGFVIMHNGVYEDVVCGYEDGDYTDDEILADAEKYIENVYFLSFESD